MPVTPPPPPNAPRRSTYRSVRRGVQRSISAWLRQPIPAACFALVLVLLAIFLLRVNGVLEPLELMAYDKFVLMRSKGEGVDPRVVEIAVTEHDLQHFAWPLPDGVLAEIIDKLRQAMPRAIGIDIFRPAPIGPGTEALDRAIAATPQLIWVDRFSEQGWQGIPAPAAAAAAHRVGFSDLVLDGAGHVRRALLYLNDDKHWEEAFSLKLALLYLAGEGITPAGDEHQWLRLGRVSLPPLEPAYGGYENADARGYQILREFRAPARISVFSLSDLFAGTIPAAQLRDRIVVVGVIADSVKDFVTTPLDTAASRGTAGSTLQGLFAAQLLQHAIDGIPPTHPLRRVLEFALIALVITCGGGVGMRLRQSYQVVGAILLGALIVLGGSYGAFLKGLWLPVVPMTLGWATAAAATNFARASAESAQRGLLMRLFSAYLSEPIAHEIWLKRGEIAASGRPVPLRLTATILFADINDFTTVSEALDPDTVVRWLHFYMDETTRLVDEHGGVVERFQGDGTLAMWGVPIARHRPEEIATDANAAVRCALRIGESLSALNEQFRAQGLPEMRIGIGIYSGELVGCTLGSSARQQYTTIGDTTNTAARLVTVAKDVMRSQKTNQNYEIVVGGSTRALLRDEFIVKPLGNVALKGKSQPIECFEIAGERDRSALAAVSSSRRVSGV